MFCRREDRGKRKEGEGTFFLKKNTRESLLRFLVTNKYIFRGLFMSVSSGLFHSLSQLHSMEKLSSILCAFYQWTFQLSHSFIHSLTRLFSHSFILAVTSHAVRILFICPPFPHNLVYICWINSVHPRHKCVCIQV